MSARRSTAGNLWHALCYAGGSRREEHAATELGQLAREIEARLLQRGRRGEIRQVYAADRMSDLLEQATPETLLVTNLSNTHLARLAELMDVPALCLAGGIEPSAELLQTAEQAGTAVLVSPVDAALTLARVRASLAGLGGQGAQGGTPRGSAPGGSGRAPSTSGPPAGPAGSPEGGGSL